LKQVDQQSSTANLSGWSEVADGEPSQPVPHQGQEREWVCLRTQDHPQLAAEGHHDHSVDQKKDPDLSWPQPAQRDCDIFPRNIP
jgi:hypothetical protein